MRGNSMFLKKVFLGVSLALTCVFKRIYAVSGAALCHGCADAE